MQLKPSTTLSRARLLLRDRLDEGTKCPCCRQFAKVYQRRVYGTMAYQLIDCYRQVGREDFHLPTLVPKHCGDFNKMRYWGLIDQDEHGSGWWRITRRGERFILGRRKIPRYIRIYNGSFLGFVDKADRVGIRESLGVKWDYDEMMNLHRRG